MTEKQHHRMDHDRSAIKTVLTYGSHIFDCWGSDINRTVVDLANVAPGDVVVDVGAGMGAGVFEAARQGATKIYGVEPSPFMRSILRARIAASRHRTKISVRGGYAEDLGIQDNTVDIMWLVNVAHHIGDLGEAAQEFARVLRPGASLLIVDEDFSDEAHPYHEEMKKRHGRHHSHGGNDGDDQGDVMIDFEEFAAELRSAGFANVEPSTSPLSDVPSRHLLATR